MPRQIVKDTDLTTLVERGWAVRAKLLERTFKFASYAEGLAFVVRVAFQAERRDHHPEIVLSYGSVTVGWTTHDVDGISELDVEMAEFTDRIRSESEGGGTH